MRFQNKKSCLEDYKDSFATQDLDQAKYQISKIFKPHELNVLGKRQSLDAKLGWTDFGGTTFIYLHHGAGVNIYPEKLEGFFLLQIPISGGGQVRIDKSVIDISSKMGYMISPTLDVEMRFFKNCEHICLKIGKEKMEGFLEQLLQRSLNKSLEFVPQLTINESKNRELVDLITYISNHLNVNNSSFHHPLVNRQAVSLLLSNILVSLEHNYHTELTAEIHAPRPYYIKKAQTYIHDNIENSITPEDVAREACISLRSIYAGFQHYLDTTPMAYIKQAKLNKVHKKLEELEPLQTSVSEIAMNYGFSHLGNFAASYRKKYGELPSDTLRKVVTR